MLPQYDRTRVSEDGMKIGRFTAKLAAVGISKLRVDDDAKDSRCSTCAFREGTVPNGCPQTQMDALKATMEGVEFQCHVREGESCFGWVAARVAKRETGIHLPTDHYSFSGDGISEHVEKPEDR